MEICNKSITELKGVGPKNEKLLNSIGISTVGELLYYFPTRYNFYKYYNAPSDINESGKSLFYIMYDGKAVRKYSPQTGYYVKWQCSCENKNIVFTWFNQPYMLNSLEKGKRYCVKCDIDNRGSLLTAVNPHFDAREVRKCSIMEPVYRLPKGISASRFSGFVKEALLFSESLLKEYIPEDIRLKYDILPLNEALGNVHCPVAEEQAVKGMKRFIFEEFFLFGVRRNMGKLRENSASAAVSCDMSVLTGFFEGLPYELTEAQLKAVRDVVSDLASDKPMNRLIQGDVGSGKTIVAFAACLAASSGGVQSMIMAPTEVLAKQHMNSFEALFKNYDIKAGLLVGSMTAKTKKCVKEAFYKGDIDVLIGTQAVLEEDSASDNVGLVITDEQHRFGVRQRLELKNKGRPVNMLLLTATPIPRTLSLIIYSDLDVSVIDEMPKGRIPVKTYCRRSSSRDKVYAFAVNEIRNGNRVYVICPSVDDEDENKASVKLLYEALSANELKEARCAMLYGAMRPSEKESVMSGFASGNIDVVISTTVVEVGVNVPEATVMIIENAERFGLAQLHQLRGRVGRGNKRSYCILISDSETDMARARLAMLEHTNDGFEIAQEDMRLRGQGEYFGLKQHGAQQFRLGELPRDMLLFAQASEAAELVCNNKERYSTLYTYARSVLQGLNDTVVFN